MRPSLSPALAATLSLVASQAMAQEPGYPAWIADAYCSEATDESKCRAGLTLDDLNGPPHFPSGEGAAAWGLTGTLPRLGTCSYSHPAHPEWDYAEPCFFVTRQGGIGRETTIIRTGVRNGSTFSAVSIDTGDGTPEHTVNDLPAERLESDTGLCYRTVAEQETLCVFPQVPPVFVPTPEPVATPAAPDPATPEQSTPPVTPAAPPVAPVATGDGPTCSVLYEEITLTRYTCAEVHTCSDMGCFAAYRGDGMDTVTLTLGGDLVVEIDGAPAAAASFVAEAAKCVAYAGTPFRFCYAP